MRHELMIPLAGPPTRVRFIIDKCCFSQHHSKTCTIKVASSGCGKVLAFSSVFPA